MSTLLRRKNLRFVEQIKDIAIQNVASRKVSELIYLILKSFKLFIILTSTLPYRELFERA